MKHIYLTLTLLCCTASTYTADDTQPYTVMAYDNERDHNEVFDLQCSDNFESSFPKATAEEIFPKDPEKKNELEEMREKMHKKIHRKLNDGISWNEFPGGETPCPRFTFRTSDEKKQVVGYALFFTRTDTGKGLIDTLYVHKAHNATLYPLAIATILNVMHNTMKVACVTAYNRDQKTRDADNQLDYEQFIKAGFKEATPDSDEAYENQCIRLEHTAQD